MDREKILKLFQGTGEDMIIACNMLANTGQAFEIIKEWESLYPENLKKYYVCERKEPERGFVIFNHSYQIFNEKNGFYYKISDKEYIVCDIGRGFGICYTNYSEDLEVINHF